MGKKNFNYNGVNVKFPFESYVNQRQIMLTILDCLQNKTSCLIESPHGSGKTIVLLCSSLAWYIKKFKTSDDKGNKIKNIMFRIINAKFILRCCSTDYILWC